MNSSQTGKNFIRTFFLLAAAGLFLTALIVFLIDPFFHYHNVWFGLSPVQTNAEYQVNGALEHLNYDSVLLGSSVTANMNQNILDDAYGSNTIKAAGAGARPSLLYYYMQKAFANQDLKYVYFGLDYFFLTDEFEEDSKQTQVLYLRDKNPFNDVNYLWNKEVLFSKIPNMIAESYLHDYDDGMAYNFARYSDYGIDYALKDYQPSMQIVEQIQTEDVPVVRQDGSICMVPDVSDNVKINIGKIEEVVQAHPETEFYFFFPVTGILWWDRAYNGGDVEVNCAMMKYSIAVLDQYDNVTFFKGVVNRPDCILDLDQYCDTTHASYAVNCETARTIASGEGILTMDNIDEEQDKLRNLVYSFEKQIQAAGNYDCLYEYTGMFEEQ